MKAKFSMKSGLDHAKILAQKADSDLKVCEISLQHDGPLDVVAFHLQQAVEKLLKALLAARTIVYPKTHDLDELMNLLPPDFSTVLSFRERISGWTAYAVDIRYEIVAYEKEELHEALATAQSLRETVLGLILPISELNHDP